ncbi:MAG: hypothetical protein WCJ57_03465 [Candidatus Falkowbacteria bacterium]
MNFKGVFAFFGVRNEIKSSGLLVDLSAKPFCPEQFLVEKHVGWGFWEFNHKLNLYYLKKRRKEVVRISSLCEEFLDSQLLNANVLDYLLANQKDIPEKLKGQRIYFLGTIYAHSPKTLCVRYLFWNDSEWSWGVNCIDNFFSDKDSIALS